MRPTNPNPNPCPYPSINPDPNPNPNPILYYKTFPKLEIGFLLVISVYVRFACMMHEKTKLRRSMSMN